MNLTEHLQELRKRLIWIVLIFAGSLIIGLVSTNSVFTYLKNIPPADSIGLNVFSPWDAIGIWMRFAFIIAIIVGLPFTLYQLWAFVKVGLHTHEQKATFRYIPYAVLMFLIGLSFAYYIVFPMAFAFTLNVTHKMGLQEVYGIAQYFKFMINILLPVSLLFELPIIVMFLTRIRLINPQLMRKIRKPAYLVLIALAVLLTPPDFISDILVAVPLLILFEISIFLSSIIYKKQQLQQQGGLLAQ